MVNGFTFFKYDRVVKLHFTTEQYNLFDQKAVSKGLTFEKFLAKRDYNVYNALSRKFLTDQHAIAFLVANYVYKNDNPIHNIASSDRNYVIWTKRKQSMTNTFREDLDKIALYLEQKNLLVDVLFDSKGKIPELFKIYLSGNVTIETMYLINKLYPYVEGWKKEHSLIWGKEFLLIEKLDRFIKFDEEILRNIYTNTLQAD
jgi:hypothetical protein